LKKSRSASRRKSRSASRSVSRRKSRSASRSVSRRKSRSVLKKSKSRSVMHKSVFRSRGRRVPREKDDEDVKKVDNEDILKARKVDRDRPSILACVNKSKTHLTNIQTATADFFANDNVKSLLVVFGTGVGKTLLAITSAECYLQRHPTHNVIVLTTKTLVSNFENQFEKYGKVREDKYNIFSFNSYMNALKKKTEYNCKNTLLIIDEVHILRNYKGKLFEAAMSCAKKANKVLLLTATPFVNAPTDFISIINLLHQKYILAPNRRHLTDEDRAHEIYKVRTKYTLPYANSSVSKLLEKPERLHIQLHIITNLLKGRISYAQRVGNFPTVELHEVLIPMSPEYERAFYDAIKNAPIFDNPATFANGYRRAVNSIGQDKYINGKLQEAIKIIKNDKSPYARNLIFSNWIKFGVEVLEKLFSRNKITYAIISGDVSAKERTQIVKDFNNGNVNTLIITKAGAEGIDLKGVQQIIVLDPVWNNATLDQIKGRGERNNSHADLPPEFQRVDIYLLKYVEQNFIDGIQEKSLSGDYLLYETIARKVSIEQPIINMMKKISIL
jgi:superfamily II DNA or RNA helicase